ncbi:MAG: hypothetical protein ACRDOC_02620, partial [Streptosporangiaceae bacterium]
SGARLFLDVCAAPDVERIILLDAPAVPRRGSSASRSSTGSCVASWPAPERPGADEFRAARPSFLLGLHLAGTGLTTRRE